MGSEKTKGRKVIRGGLVITNIIITMIIMMNKPDNAWKGKEFKEQEIMNLKIIGP